ncbi:MAG: hypothetical protein CVT99_06400 [Bacteroidetes bacterium HGW-Bacteroidetes-16]|jgi:hypothetical protein|nr:MAG: hypothetical protein CVT99_06400 [Bacteroidetes bacterium HGW-Bacteroidetes-16]
MNIELTGKLIQKMAPVSGEGKNGKWEKQEFVIETDDQYPKKICMNVWGEKLSALAGVVEGDHITASVNIESREFNGRWYTDIRAWRIQRGSDEGSTPAATLPNLPPDDLGLPEDDLPF